MLYNKSSKQKIIEKVRVADWFLPKLKGLMFERRGNFDYAIIFDFGSEGRLNCSLHMLFVFFPIDILFLDARKKVVDIVRGAKPFALFIAPQKASRYAVELSQGKAKSVKIGDTIDWG